MNIPYPNIKNKNTTELNLELVDIRRRENCTCAILARIDVSGALNGAHPHDMKENETINNYTLRKFDEALNNNSNLSYYIMDLSKELERTRKTKQVSKVATYAPLTMSSKEISDLTGKQHLHIMRDIRRMLKCIELDEKGYIQNWIHPQNGQKYPIFHLPKDLTLTLVSGYNVKLRHAIVKRWIELEEGIIKTNDTPLKLENKLELEAFKRLSSANGSLTITDAAKHLQVTPKYLFQYLQLNNWIYRRAGNKAFHGKAYRTNKGDLTHKITTITTSDGEEKIKEQVRITPQGLTKLAKDLN